MNDSVHREKSRWRKELRQRRQHPPFRIAAPVWDAEERARLQRLITEVATATEAAVTGAADRARAAGRAERPARQAVPPPLDESAIAEAATNLWRAQKRATRSARDGSRDARQIGRYLKTSQDALDSAGVTCQSHDGERFHPGLSLEVLAYEEDPALRAETVLETVRPTIYLAGRRIQMGQVVVGSPADPGTASPAAASPAEDNHA